MTRARQWTSAGAAPLRGTIAIPGDKSISHRAIMLAALAEGTSRIDGFLEGADTRTTAAIFAQLGVDIDAPAPGVRRVHGVGLHGLRAPRASLDCGNAGTAMRLLAGLLAGQRFDSELTGDASLSRRPMQRVIDPLSAMGAHIVAAPDAVPPLRISGNATLHGISHQPTVASAQVKSALLLAGLYAEGETEIREAHPTRDYSERMLAAFGWPVAFGKGWVRLRGGFRLRATDIQVPGDFSSAAFFIVAATVVPGSDLLLRGVGLNPRRTGLLQVLSAMGADIVEANVAEGGLSECAGERVADLRVRHAPLRGIEVPAHIAPDMIDEFPILFVAAAAADGITTITGATELRHKESDRIAAMTMGLGELGIEVEEMPDGAAIRGGVLHGGSVDSAGDHRCAMSFAVAGAIAGSAVRIADCANVGTSFPGFVALANSCGFNIASSEC